MRGAHLGQGSSREAWARIRGTVRSASCSRKPSGCERYTLSLNTASRPGLFRACEWPLPGPSLSSWGWGRVALKVLVCLQVEIRGLHRLPAGRRRATVSSGGRRDRPCFQ